MKTALILGGKSDIAKALAVELCKQKVNLFLAARNANELKDFKIELENKFANKIFLIEFDALAFDTHEKIFEQLPISVDAVFCVFGFLGEQKKAETNRAEMFRILETNYAGAVSILEIIAGQFEKKKQGLIVGISSVAGERGRQSNYFYGSSKAGFTAYLSGLRNRLHKSNVHVLTVIPGYVKTAMTSNLQLPPVVSTTPDVVAKAITKAIANKKSVIYVPGIWRSIMLFIKLIPEFIFKKLKL